MKTIQWSSIIFVLIFAFVLPGIAPASAAASFAKDLTWSGITFHVSSTNLGAVNKVRILFSGPGVDPAPVTSLISGTVTWAEVTDDLDDDGSPELYVYATCPGDLSLDTDHGNYFVPSLVTAVTRYGHGGVVGIPPVVVLSGDAQPGAAVAIEPGVIRRSDGVTVRALSVLPFEAPEQDNCIHELKFILADGKNGRTLQLENRQ